MIMAALHIFQPKAAELSPEVHQALRAVLKRFTDGLIVRMVPLLAVLREALPEQVPAFVDPSADAFTTPQ